MLDGFIFQGAVEEFLCRGLALHCSLFLICQCFINENEQHKIKKEKYVIQPEGAEITYLAGLYRFEEHRGIQVPMFTVITRAAVGTVSNIHDRMPLILSKDNLNEWIHPNGDPYKIAKMALTKMIMEKAKDYPSSK